MKLSTNIIQNLDRTNKSYDLLTIFYNPIDDEPIYHDQSGNIDLRRIVKEKFGIHRGFENNNIKPNSIDAIKKALSLNPPFVEFDIVLHDGIVKTSHPPQEPLDKIEDILDLFKSTTTFPKIDVKMKRETSLTLIEKIFKLAIEFNRFTLINLSGVKNRNFIMEIEEIFYEKIKNHDKIKLNIDLARYKKPKEEIDDDIRIHVKKICKVIHSISPEIHEENWDSILSFAKENNIKYVYFWLRGWPDQPNPEVKVDTILNALKLEVKYGIKIFFDINFNFVKF